MNIEQKRLSDNKWKKWGPYLSERQWGTVREDYSEHGEAWDYFPHDHARSRVYRWGEDGIAGISDDMQRICFAVALWYRNLWSFGLSKDKPLMYLKKGPNGYGEVKVIDYSAGEYHFYFDKPARTLFTENETNTEKLYGQPNKTPFVKDAFHTAVTQNNYDWLESKKEGTKFSPMYEFNIEGQSSVTIKLRLSKKRIDQNPFDETFDTVFSSRIKEADEFYNEVTA